MKAIDIDDMECCKGTEKQPHPGVWFYRPMVMTETETEFHMNEEPVGNCPVCVILKHVIPVVPSSTGHSRGRLETKP